MYRSCTEQEKQISSREKKKCQKKCISRRWIMHCVCTPSDDNNIHCMHVTHLIRDVTISGNVGEIKKNHTRSVFHHREDKNDRFYDVQIHAFISHSQFSSISKILDFSIDEKPLELWCDTLE